MAGSTKKSADKKMSAPKEASVTEAVKDAVANKASSQGPQMVEVMHPEAYRLAIAIVNQSDIKGGDAETVVLLKRELARVSGNLTAGQPRA